VILKRNNSQQFVVAKLNKDNRSCYTVCVVWVALSSWKKEKEKKSTKDTPSPIARSSAISRSTGRSTASSRATPASASNGLTKA
jgi:hypothetical protein